MNAERLLQHFDRISESPDAIRRLRRFVLDLAVRGKLVPQDSNDEPAAELLKRIQAEKQRLVKNGMLKAAKPVQSRVPSTASAGMPETWLSVHLQDVCTSITDGDHLPPPKSETGVPFLVIGNVRSKVVQFDGCRHVPDSYYQELDATRRPTKGDVLYTLVGSYGIPVVVRNERPFCVQRHIGILRPSKHMNLEFFSRLLESELVFDQATECATGIAQKTVSLVGLRAIRIILPPLVEQHRIVAKVDELMSLCDQLEAAKTEREQSRDRLVAASLHRLDQSADIAEAEDPEAFRAHASFTLDNLPRLTTRPAHINQLRQTILNLAVHGKLVPQDPNDEPASELLKRIRAEKERQVTSGELRKQQSLSNLVKTESRPDIPSSWLWICVDDCFNVSGGIQKTPARAPRNNAYPYIGVGNVYRDWLDLAEVKQFELLEGELEKFRLLTGDILVVEGNGSASEIGRCAVWTGEIEDCVHQNHIIRCRPFILELTPYVMKYLNAPSGMGVMKALAVTSSGLYSLSVGKIRRIMFPLPPLPEQHRIVAKVDELMALCDRLEAQLTTTEADGRRLLEAVLHEALAPVAEEVA